MATVNAAEQDQQNQAAAIAAQQQEGKAASGQGANDQRPGTVV